MAGQDERAVLIRKFDQDNFLECLEVGRRPKPAPKDGEVLVRMLARPVDPAGGLNLDTLLSTIFSRGSLFRKVGST
jgi:NADPH:quinone reductase-like Zn-dependent oxidoreductase